MTGMVLSNIVVFFFVSSIAFIGPSVTTYQTHNPGYRIYEVDGDYANSSRVPVHSRLFCEINGMCIVE